MKDGAEVTQEQESSHVAPNMFPTCVCWGDALVSSSCASIAGGQHDCGDSSDRPDPECTGVAGHPQQVPADLPGHSSHSHHRT